MRSGIGEERGGAGGAEGSGEVITVIICISWLLRQYNNSNRSRICKHKRSRAGNRKHAFLCLESVLTENSKRIELSTTKIAC